MINWSGHTNLLANFSLDFVLSKDPFGSYCVVVSVVQATSGHKTDLYSRIKNEPNKKLCSNLMLQFKGAHCCFGK